MTTSVDYLIVLDDTENPFLKIVVVTITDFHAPVEADHCAFLCRVVMSTHTGTMMCRILHTHSVLITSACL